MTTFTPKPRPMSAQEAFDNVWQHFVVEGNPLAVAAMKGCLYRVMNDDGTPINGCAIGCQIPDALWKSQFEGRSVLALVETYPEMREYFLQVPTALLGELQEAHDGGSLRENLEKVARKFYLTVPVGKESGV